MASSVDRNLLGHFWLQQHPGILASSSSTSDGSTGSSQSSSTGINAGNYFSTSGGISASDVAPQGPLQLPAPSEEATASGNSGSDSDMGHVLSSSKGCNLREAPSATHEQQDWWPRCQLRRSPTWPTSMLASHQQQEDGIACLQTHTNTSKWLVSMLAHHHKTYAIHDQTQIHTFEAQRHPPFLPCLLPCPATSFAVNAVRQLPQSGTSWLPASWLPSCAWHHWAGRMGKADLRSRSHQGRRSTPRAAAGRARKTSLASPIPFPFFFCFVMSPPCDVRAGRSPTGHPNVRRSI